MTAQVPFFNCPSKRLEEIYYFRWWTFRKHIKETPDGQVLTEFIEPVSHAGAHNTISCAYVCHQPHIARQIGAALRLHPTSQGP